MAQDLVFVTGGSSGIGLAMIRSLPFEARVIDLSRRGAPGVEHVAVDLAEPEGWSTAAECFAREIPKHAGARVVLVHSAGTLEPMGFAGEVDPTAYRREVMLNAASPQVLGDAFLRAAAATDADYHLWMISSGAAHSVYLGWSAYGAGKAAMDHWVRTAGAEQAARGQRCRILAIAPGVVETAMQEQIRATSEREFPDVARFRELEEEGVLRSPEVVAKELWSLLERPLDNGAVLDLRDAAA